MSKSDGPTTNDIDLNSQGDVLDCEIEEVRKVVTEQFNKQTWETTEAVLTAQATLLLADAKPVGVVIVGESGSGKSTVLKFIKENPETYRTDDATPASFVSHDASLEEEELADVDLLPRVRHKTLVCPDMANWFSGSRENIGEKMSTMANVMDGDGYVRDSGSHGQRGYEGDYRFNIIGASTPLETRSWEAMGHTGNRFVFHEHTVTTDLDEIKEQVFDGSYDEKVSRCSETVEDLLEDRWAKHGGYSGVEQASVDVEDEARETIAYLAKLVTYSRAPINGGTVHQEGMYRIMATLKTLAQGRALLDNRTEVTTGDVEVCARIALSTMPKERRSYVKAIVNPSTGKTLTAQGFEEYHAVKSTRPTVHSRMELLDTLEIADYEEIDGRGTKMVTLKEEFEWPDDLPFPG
jgi:energy-coupling factor transporter ATP-binding protein EcfA2